MGYRYQIDIEDPGKYKIKVHEPIIPYLPAETATAPLFWLDGTVLDNEFVDASGNDRNFTITDKDFSASYFPYKSAATISAPVGDSVLIAADINNFLYNSIGTPNQISVISFFQNVDYENKLFCRHVAQAIDGDGVETTEPYITDIVLYASVLEASDLSIANTYYSVPTEQTSTIRWVTKDGDDSDAGTKAAPWLTIQESDDTADAGDLTYIQTGDYEEDSALHNLWLQRDVDFTALGLVEVTPSAQEYTIRETNDLGRVIKNLIVSLSSAVNFNRPLYNGNDTASTYDRCKLLNVNTTDTTYAAWLISRQTFTNSILISKTGNVVSQVLRADGSLLTVTGCYLEGASNLVTFAAAIAGNTVTFNYNKVSGGYSDSLFALSQNATYNIKYNEFSIDDGAKFFNISSACTVNFEYNTLTSGFDLSSSDFLTFDDAGGGITINNNTIELIAGFSQTGVIVLANQATSDVENNIIKTLKTDQVSQVEISSTGTTVDADVINNRLDSSNAANYIINIGSETTAAGDDDISGAVISKNNILGVRNTTPTSTPTVHNAFIGFNINATLQYNFSSGGGIGGIFKGSSSAFASGGMFHNIIKDNAVGLYLKGVQDVNVYNNTVINTLDEAFIGFQALINTGGDGSTGTEFKNNIVIDESSHANNLLVRIDTASDTGLDFDYNIYYAPAPLFRKDSTDYTFTEWQALGYDANSVLLTSGEYAALFTDKDNVDFSLPTGSDAIGAGVDLGASYDDGLDSTTAWGDSSTIPVIVTKQQTGSWDVGAYVS